MFERFQWSRFSKGKHHKEGFRDYCFKHHTEVVADLYVAASDLIDFHCNQPLVNKMININRINCLISKARDDDGVRMVQSTQNSPLLSFCTYGKKSTWTMATELEAMEGECDVATLSQIPLCGIMMETGAINQLITEVKDTNCSTQVSITMMEKNDFPAHNKVQYNAIFVPKHLNSLERATKLGSQFIMKIQAETVMLYFDICIGHLQFSYKADVSSDVVAKEPLIGRGLAGALSFCIHRLLWDGCNRNIIEVINCKHE